MMLPDPTIISLLAEGRPLRSLEFFPPKDDEGVANLKATAGILQRIHPDFVSVTYGAGGSTRERSSQISEILKREFGFTVMPHLTCVGSTKSEIAALAHRMNEAGFSNIMTLRGDPPKGQAAFEPYPDGLRYASDLVALLRKEIPRLCLGVAGYPEKHPEAPSGEADLDNLKRKVDEGAAFITTQLFFDNDMYYRFVEKCRARNILIPIMPGIMPVLSLKQIQRFTQLCGASLPNKLIKRLETAGDYPDAVEAVGIDWSLTQIRDLLAQSAPGYHLYILNRAKSAVSLAAGLAA